MKHDADFCSGPEYAYLGHFQRREFLCQGHNQEDIGTYVPSSEGEGIVKDPNLYETYPDQPRSYIDQRFGSTADRYEARMRGAAFGKEVEANVQRQVGRGRDDPLDNAMRATRSKDYGKDI